MCLGGADFARTFSVFLFSLLRKYGMAGVYLSFATQNGGRFPNNAKMYEMYGNIE